MQALLLIGLLFLQAVAAPPAGGVVTGRVVFADGVPVASTIVRPIPVSLAGPQSGTLLSPGFGFTNANGEFRLQNLAPGRYFIQLGTPADAPMYYPGVAAESGATAITVLAGTNNDELYFALPPSAAFRVLGHVTIPPGQSGSPRVQLSGNNPPSSPISSDGTFELLHVRPGRYAITVTPAPGMQPRPIVVSDGDLTGVELSVPRLIPVIGSVVTDGGTARPRFSLAIEGTVYRTNVPVAPDGVFAPQLPAGDYLIRLSGLPPGYYLKSLTADKTDLLAKPLKIAATDSSVPLKVTFGVSPGVKVSGRVTIAGKNLATTSIESLLLVSRSMDQPIEAPLDRDDSFKLDKIMPGSYQAMVTLASNLTAPLVPVVIPTTDTSDLEILVPPEVEVFGRVAVDGYGPPPKFSLLLVRGSDIELSAAKPGEVPSLSTNALFTAARGGSIEGVQMNINALPDGSFKMKLPEGDYRVAAAPGPNGIPSAYFLSSFRYGSADLLKEPMTISGEKPSELQIGFGTTAANAWVKLNGKVTGAEPAKGPYRVALEGSITSTIEALVSQDGTFEFPRILQGTRYTARLIPKNDAATAPGVTVADKDVGGVEIVVPAEKEVKIVTSVQGDGAVPGYVMSFAGSGSTVTVVVKPERDGTFRANVPADERRLRVTSFPLGYVLKSVSYGPTDVMNQPMRIMGGDPMDIEVTFAMDQNLPFASLRGHVSGLDPTRGAVRLVLNDAAAFSSFEASVDSDGAFSFSKIPQGTYVPALIGSGLSGLLSPSTIVISGLDALGIELTAPKPSTRPELPPIDVTPTGVVVSNLAGGREAANESSAVAQLRTINTAEVTYLSSNSGRYGTIADMIKAGLLDTRFNGAVSGFTYGVIAVGTIYTAVAVPSSQGTARYGYYSTADAVIHYSTLDSLAPPQQPGKVVQ